MAVSEDVFRRQRRGKRGEGLKHAALPRARLRRARGSDATHDKEGRERTGAGEGAAGEQEQRSRSPTIIIHKQSFVVSKPLAALRIYGEEGRGFNRLGSRGEGKGGG
jgi:hypothetical protein